jgi:hypothetical protein
VFAPVGPGPVSVCETVDARAHGLRSFALVS